MQNINLTFAPQVGGLQRLNRLAGKVEGLALPDHAFKFSLPGGTGDLFKYGTGEPFAGTRQVKSSDADGFVGDPTDQR